MLRAGATSFYNADGLGSITSLSNVAGTLAQTYTFDSSGKQTASSGSLTNPFRYTAREWGAEASMTYYRLRYYDPFVSRFISEDPIRFWGGTNFYEYARNNSALFADPFGTLPGPTCLYFMYKCSQTAQECVQALNKAAGGDPGNLCRGTNSANPDDAYYKVCFQGNYFCQKMTKTCGEGAANPPFSKTNMGSGPPGGIGPKPDSPTPTTFPPNYPGKPLSHVY